MIHKFEKLTDADNGKWVVFTNGSGQPYVTQIEQVTMDGQRFESSEHEEGDYFSADSIKYVCDNKQEAKNVEKLLRDYEQAKQRALVKLEQRMDKEAYAIVDAFAIKANTLQLEIQSFH